FSTPNQQPTLERPHRQLNPHLRLKHHSSGRFSMTKDFPAGAPDSSTTSGIEPEDMTPGARYMALTAAFLGWMFDGFDMGLFPLVGRQALRELMGPSANIGDWFAGMM